MIVQTLRSRDSQKEPRYSLQTPQCVFVNVESEPVVDCETVYSLMDTSPHDDMADIILRAARNTGRTLRYVWHEAPDRERSDEEIERMTRAASCYTYTVRDALYGTSRRTTRNEV